MSRTGKVELLAPAGSYEAFKAGLNAGADAFYLGAERFGARAYAENFSRETLFDVLDEAHIFGKRIYLTVNTLIKEQELDELYNMLLPLYEHGLDAAIVQDLGAFRFIKESFPGLALHASTQMTVTGFEGAGFIEKCGASRVIPARELSLDEIRKIRSETSLEIECFVHGALCYCYSGACLMSSFIGGRSGNRGRCAQPCRMPYKVYRDGKLISDKNNGYALNTRDICLIDNVAELADAGIDSFKIEGRMKRPEYTAGVVSVYRKYLDLYEEGKARKASESDKELLRALFNRGGFSKGYFFTKGAPPAMSTDNARPSRENPGSVENAYKKIRENVLSRTLKKSLRACFTVDPLRTAHLEVSDGVISASARYKGVDRALKRPLGEEDVLKQLGKTGETHFSFEDISVSMPDDVFMTARQLNELRRTALDNFSAKAAAAHYRSAVDTGEIFRGQITGKGCRETDTVHDYKTGLVVSVLTRSQFDLIKDLKEIDAFYLPYRVYTDEISEDEKNRYRGRIVLALPYISRSIRNSEAYKREILNLAKSGMRFLVRNLEDAAFLIKNGYNDRIRLDYTLYTMNSQSLSFWRETGVSENTAPAELNCRELSERDNSESGIIVYGRLPVMVSAGCVVKSYSGCDRSSASVTLTDRTGADFRAVSDCTQCCSLIYNSVPVSLMSEMVSVKRLGFRRYRVSITFEDDKTVTEIIHSAVKALKGEGGCQEEFAFTKGHFRRGVE